MTRPHPDEIKALFKSQKDYFSAGNLRDLSRRLNTLRRLRRWIKEHEKEIAAALYSDLGKSSKEAYITEIGLVLNELRVHLRHARSWSRGRRILPALNNFPARSRIHPEPYGAILSISPWNYPFLLSVQPLVGMISAGNTAILKPSELAPATSRLIADMIRNIFDPGHVAVIEGGKEEAEALLRLPFDTIFYTGSASVARLVMKAAAEHLTPVTLELGGKSPVIVHRDANLRSAARRIAWGKTLNAGQTCVAPDYVFVHEDIREKLISEIQKSIHEFYGPDLQASPYARIINDGHFTRLSDFLRNASVLSGGKSDAATRYIEPTLIDNPDPDSPIMQEEIFGPLLPILSYQDPEDVIRFVNSRPKPLALYLFTSSRKLWKHVNASTSSGAFTVNDTIMHLGNHRLPFGGVGGSGMGAYHGRHSFFTFSHSKAVMINSRFPDIPVRYAPVSRFREALLRFFLR